MNVGHWHRVCSVVTNLSFGWGVTYKIFSSQCVKNEEEVAIHLRPPLNPSEPCNIWMSSRGSGTQQRRETGLCRAVGGEFENPSKSLFILYCLFVQCRTAVPGIEQRENVLEKAGDCWSYTVTRRQPRLSIFIPDLTLKHQESGSGGRITHT